MDAEPALIDGNALFFRAPDPAPDDRKTPGGFIHRLRPGIPHGRGSRQLRFSRRYRRRSRAVRPPSSQHRRRAASSVTRLLLPPFTLPASRPPESKIRMVQQMYDRQISGRLLWMVQTYFPLSSGRGRRNGHHDGCLSFSEVSLKVSRNRSSTRARNVPPTTFCRQRKSRLVSLFSTSMSAPPACMQHLPQRLHSNAVIL